MSWNTVNTCLTALGLLSIVDSIEIDIIAANTRQIDITEPILSDVMKNITRVNTMLQELIKNYEKLERISKAHSEESDSIDTEVEALFDDDGKKSYRAKSKPSTAYPMHKVYATAMFFDESDLVPDSKSDSHNTKSSSDSEEDIEEEKPKKEEVKLKKKFEPSKKKENQEKKEHQNKNEFENEDKKEKKIDEKPPELKRNGGKVENKAEERFVPAVKEMKYFEKNLSDDQASTYRGKEKDKNSSPVIISRTSTAEPTTPGIFKLNSEELNLATEKEHLEPRLEAYAMPEISRRVRKSNDHDTILIGTLVKKNLTEKKEEKANRTKVIGPIDNKTQLSLSESDTESSEDTKMIKKEELKTNVLRQAYGDACLKLVVRKCYKACKSVLKDVCSRRRRCPKDIRAVFKTNAMRKCKDVFHNRNASVDFRSGRNEDEGSDDFEDVTRIGHLSMSCFPDTPTPVEKQANSTSNVTIDPAVRSMNILRDRYETACQEESMRKCYKACSGAAKQACQGDHKCSKRRMKEFGESCKRYCKQNYGVRDRKSKESDSDSDSDSSDSDRSDRNKAGDHRNDDDNDNSWE